MKIFVHDYAGHPFQVHLSRHLALRGHEVTHGYFAGDPGPKGVLERRPEDPPGLQFAAIGIDRRYDKNSLIARHFNDRVYGQRASRLIASLRPDVVISGNTPTAAQRAIIRACRSVGAGFVYWLQDFYSIAVSKLLRKRLGGAGALIGWYYRLLERSQLRDSDAVVVITEDFRRLAAAWAGSDRKVVTIENWAALEDIPLCPKDNGWAREHGLSGQFTYLYSGTLGLKHNPALLVRLAQTCGPDACVAVVAQGQGMKQLEAAKAEQGLDALRLLPLQPAPLLPDVLASGDVLVAVIEVDAGSYSVPSKVQSYLCAGRPILLASPAENLAARVVTREAAGLVVTPDDEAGFLAAAARLRADAALRLRQGAQGRAYAERSFDTMKIADMFEQVLFTAAKGSRARGPMPVAQSQPAT
jgi:glycosyltransferase involved in cell wall biosynthesis